MLPAVDQDLDYERRKSSAAARAFFRIVEAWGVDDAQASVLLGSPPPREFESWKHGDVDLLPHDTMERISYLLGIYKALQLLFEPAQADEWVSKPNEYFSGRSALDQMLAGNVVDLFEVRRYLDYVRGGRS